MIISIKYICKPYIYFSIIFIMFYNISCNANNIPDSIKKIKVEEQLNNIPKVNYTNLKNQSKNLFKLSKNNILIINFWALWCSPCIKEMPALKDLAYKIEGAGVKIIYINQDSYKDYKKVKSFIEKLNIYKQDVFMDFDTTSNKIFKLRGIPTTLIIERSSKILWRIEGVIDWKNKDLISWLKNGAKKN